MRPSRWANLALGTSLGQAFSVSIGAGSSVTARLGSPPVVADGRVFTIDTTATVRAFDAQSGAAVWSTQFGTEKGNSDSLYGGGVAVEGGRVYATNGLGFVAALDATNGGIVWSVRPGGPLRGAPSVADGTFYVTSQDNQIYSLKMADGATNWSNAASLEIAGVFGSGSPAVGAGDDRRRILVGRAQRLPLREWPPGLAGRPVADQHVDRRVVAVGHRRQSGDRRRTGVRGRPGRANGRTRAQQRTAPVGAQHRRDCHSVGGRRLGLCRDRQRQIDRAVARQRQDPLDQPTAPLPEGKIANRARSAMSARSWPAGG